MSLWIDKNFIETHLRYHLTLFEWEREYLAHFRCPICGDSAKSQTKRRAYFYEDVDGLRFKCHNCSEMSGWSLGAWLSKFDPSMQREYNMMVFKESGGSLKRSEEEWRPPKATRTESVVKSAKRLPEKLLEHSTALSELPTDHFAKKYASERLIPSWGMDLMTYVDDYRKFIEGIGITDEELLKRAPNDERIIIPLLSETYQLLGVQGRALRKDAFLRYATNKLDPTFPKVFGLHRLNKKKPILVVEGPIDSMFLPNCVATADSNLLSFSNGSIYIPDNQYRNLQICNIVDKIIASGKPICLFPKELEQYKDINDMVQKGGISSNDLCKIILGNTHSGLKAKMVWSTRRGV